MQTVRIKSDAINKWATIERSMLASITAATCLGDERMVNELIKLKKRAQREYESAVLRKLNG